MQSKTVRVLALDVGERRTGVAMGDGTVRIAIPLDAVDTSSLSADTLKQLVEAHSVDTVVVGMPRNLSGEETAQSNWVRNFVDGLGDIGVPMVYQDESLTSVLAEEQLKARGRTYSKGQIDSVAASLILQDYLEGLR